MIKHLADRLANKVQFAAAAGASLMPQIEPDILTHQMRRQARSIDRRRLGSGGRLRAWREPGLGPRKIDAQVFETKLELILIEPLSAPAELAALQLLDDEVKSFDLGLRLGESSALDREGAHQPCSVSTSSGRAARSMFMRTKSS